MLHYVHQLHFPVSRLVLGRARGFKVKLFHRKQLPASETSLMRAVRLNQNNYLKD